MRGKRFTLPGLLLCSACACASSAISGRVLDPQGHLVAGPAFRGVSDPEGRYQFISIPDAAYSLVVQAPGFAPVTQSLVLSGELALHDITLARLASQRDSIVITANSVEPQVDLRNSEVFNRTLFTRDDQVFQQLDLVLRATASESATHDLGCLWAIA
jgi:hypothetical protein